MSITLVSFIFNDILSRIIQQYARYRSTFCYFHCFLQAHLLSVFDNTKSVKFDEKVYDKILSITSQEGETIELNQHVMAQVDSLSY